MNVPPPMPPAVAPAADRQSGEGRLHREVGGHRRSVDALRLCTQSTEARAGSPDARARIRLSAWAERRSTGPPEAGRCPAPACRLTWLEGPLAAAPDTPVPQGHRGPVKTTGAWISGLTRPRASGCRRCLVNAFRRSWTHQKTAVPHGKPRETAVMRPARVAYATDSGDHAAPKPGVAMPARLHA